MAPADSEKGQVPAQGLAAERQLEGVALPERGPELGMRLLSVGLRIDIGAAGQEQAVGPIQHFCRVLRPAGGEDQGKAARRLHRPHVVLAEPEDLRLLARILDGDRDGGARHMRSGMGMPRARVRISMCRTKASTTSVRSARRSSVSAWSTEYFGFW